ncbi:MAG: type II secretion system protein [Phycisphaerae bacterium]|nr:type II secretion system protein [Phycisphaerae bacterium]
MKQNTKQFEKRAFTIIELLTVMSIIIILIGLLVPSLNMAKRYAREVRQKAQFHSIDSALELFSGEWDGYPPSIAQDEAGEEYCGAMRLCEALVGQDLMGFNPLSRFRADCTIDGATETKLYDNNPTGDPLFPTDAENLKSRKTYLQQTSDAYKMADLYGAGNTDTLDEDLYVLCDVYNRVKHRVTGKGVGMPILYYKADTSGYIHDSNNLPTAYNENANNIYNYLDNDKLVQLGLPWDTTGSLTHPIDSTVSTEKFYEITKDSRISMEEGRPYRPDSYILISAGFDGTYGTDDDIFNFNK